jgi:hypothetical protein
MKQYKTEREASFASVVKEEEYKDVLAEDRMMDKEFLGRFTKEERQGFTFVNPVLVKWEYEIIELENGEYGIDFEKGHFTETEYSANEGDYFMMNEGDTLSGALYCEAWYHGLRKRILIKEKPSREDLKNWNSLVGELVESDELVGGGK